MLNTVCQLQSDRQRCLTLSQAKKKPLPEARALEMVFLLNEGRKVH